MKTKMHDMKRAVVKMKRAVSRMRRPFLLVAGFALVSGCAAIPLKKAAGEVRLTNQEPAECKFLGEVVGSQGNWLVGPFTSNENLEVGARNDLKNKARELGANVVHLLTDRAGQSAHYSRHGGGSSQTNVTYMGAAYHCPRG
jgi:hypothetical protein